MKNMRNLEGIVRRVLEESREARDDDFLLIFKVYKLINESVIYKDFRQVMRDHVELNVFSGAVILFSFSTFIIGISVW